LKGIGRVVRVRRGCQCTSGRPHRLRKGSASVVDENNLRLLLLSTSSCSFTAPTHDARPQSDDDSASSSRRPPHNLLLPSLLLERPDVRPSLSASFRSRYSGSGKAGTERGRLLVVAEKLWTGGVHSLADAAGAFSLSFAQFDAQADLGRNTVLRYGR
jgi:hypothetical protein